MIWNNNLLTEINHMQRQMNHLFRGFWSNLDNYRDEMIDELSEGYRRAFTNFKETDKEFIIQVEVPGIEKDKIQLNITNNRLEIKAERKQEKESKEREDYSYTKSYLGFYQAFDVPENTDINKINASYKNGVLTIKIPKKIINKTKKTIQIK